jgi:hypothetical protein
LLLDLIAEYQPLGFEEKLLVEEIAKALRRKNRFESAEVLVISPFRYATIDGVEEKRDVGLALERDADSYGVISQCLVAEDFLDRRLWRLLSRLRKAQQRRGIVQKPVGASGKKTIDVGGPVVRNSVNSTADGQPRRLSLA